MTKPTLGRYNFFRELFRQHPIDEVLAWERKHVPGLRESLNQMGQGRPTDDQIARLLDALKDDGFADRLTFGCCVGDQPCHACVTREAAIIKALGHLLTLNDYRTAIRAIVAQEKGRAK